MQNCQQQKRICARSEQRNGIGIHNVKKRLGFIYPHNHELKMHDEGNFFVVSLLRSELVNYATPLPPFVGGYSNFSDEASLSAY